MTLRIAYAEHEAAAYAVKRWHYSRRLPIGKLIRFGVWEDGAFKGVIIYSRGGAPNIGKPFGLEQTQVCELTRIALDAHEAPVSQMMAITLKILKRTNPGLRLVVSYADPNQSHHGGIYQASNYVYIGQTDLRPTDAPVRILGQVLHYRTVQIKFCNGERKTIEWLRANVDPNAEQLKEATKHKYVYPLDEEMKKLVLSMRQQAPRGGSIEGDASAPQAEEGVSKRPRRSKTKP